MPWPRGAVDSVPSAPFGEEEVVAVEAALAEAAAAAAGAAAPGRVRVRHTELEARGRIELHRVERFLRLAPGGRGPVRRHVGRRLRQDPLALQLAGVLLEVFLRGLGHEDDVTLDETVRARRPRGRRARESGTASARRPAM